MDWIRANKTQAVILGIFGAIALALGVLLFLANSDYGTSLDEFESIKNKLISKEKASVYPNAENVNKMQERVDGYQASVDKLGTVLRSLQAEADTKDAKPEDATDTGFQARLKKAIADLREQVGAGSKTLPKNFAFGFDIYTISLPKSPEAAKALNDYFSNVSAVVNKAIEVGVASIDEIHRTELAIEKGAPAPSAAPQPKKPEPKAKKSTKATKGKAAAPPPKPLAQVVERRTLTLKLTTDQGPLQALLNALASPSQMPYFTIVRQVRVENEKQEGPSKNAALFQKKDTASSTPAAAPTPEAPATGADGAPAAPKVEVIVPPTPSNRNATTVIGGEKLKVYLEIDLVRFVEPQ